MLSSKFPLKLAIFLKLQLYCIVNTIDMEGNVSKDEVRDQLEALGFRNLSDVSFKFYLKVNGGY